MRILITGGAGFIGSHLADALIARGDLVTVLDNLSTGRRENIAHLVKDARLQFVEGNILDTALVERLAKDIDCVYHLAAAVGVELVVKKPLDALTTNIHGTEIVLDAAAKYQKKILLASTSEIYGKNTKRGLTEDDDRILGSPLKSRWGYSAAKGIDELMGYLYWKEKGLPVVLVRFFNTVGPRQTGAYGMVIPRFVSQAINGGPLTVYGDGKQQRSFLHVRDAVAAIIGLMDNPKAVGNVFNVGNEEEVSIEALAKKIIAMTGSRSSLTYVPYEQAYGDGFEDMQRRFPSTERLRSLTGWKPTADLNAILQSVIDANQRL